MRKKKIHSLDEKGRYTCLCGTLIVGTLGDYVTHSEKCEVHINRKTRKENGRI